MFCGLRIDLQHTHRSQSDLILCATCFACLPCFSNLKVSSLRVGTVPCNFCGYRAPESPLLKPPLQSLDYGRGSMSNILCPIDWPNKAGARQLGWELIHKCFTFIFSFYPYFISFSPQDRHCCVCFTDKKSGHPKRLSIIRQRF